MRIAGGVAGNVVPDECVVTVNFRFAPDRDAAAAEAHVREVLDGFEVTVTDLAAGALPGLGAPAARGVPRCRRRRRRRRSTAGPTSSRFAALGIPALNYGPGDPNLAHTREEHVRRPGRSRKRPRSSADSWSGADRRHYPGGHDRANGRPAAPRRSSAVRCVLRREHRNESTTTDQRLLDSRGPSDWVHTDPWRVLRIQAEFVEGFGMLAELPRAVTVFGSARTPRGPPGVRPGPGAGHRARRGRVRGDHRRRPRRDGGREQGVLRGAAGSPSGWASSCRSSRDSTSGSTWASTSGTSSPARRCSSSTRRRSSACPAGSARSTSCSRRSPWCRRRRSPSSRWCCSGTEYWGGLLRLDLQARSHGSGKIGDKDLALLHLTDDVDDAVQVVHGGLRAWEDTH